MSPAEHSFLSVESTKAWTFPQNNRFSHLTISLFAVKYEHGEHGYMLSCQNVLLGWEGLTFSASLVHLLIEVKHGSTHVKLRCDWKRRGKKIILLLLKLMQHNRVGSSHSSWENSTYHRRWRYTSALPPLSPSSGSPSSSGTLQLLPRQRETTEGHSPDEKVIGWNLLSLHHLYISGTQKCASKIVVGTSSRIHCSSHK